MKLDKNSMLLYVVTDRTWTINNNLSEQVEQSILGGATFIQIREKNLSFDEFVEEGLKIKSITDQYHIPFVVNDDIDVALKINADGVHVGQNDMQAKDVRKLIGTEKILGVSAQTVEQAILAQNNGADYIGVGAIFSTSTKRDADNVSFDTLTKIVRAVSIPVVAIGGICEENILELSGTGIDGVAVISAIFSKSDIKTTSRNLLELSKRMVK